MRNDPAGIRAAQLAAEVQRLRHLTITHREQYEELRRVWPELVERIDELAAFVDWERSPDA